MTLLSNPRASLARLVPLALRRQRRYRRRFGRFPALRRPVLFSEKVTWRILYDRRALLLPTCDKLAMKEHARRTAGDLVRIPRTHWHGTDVGELADVALPARWVLKPNHRSGVVLFGEGRPDVADLRRRTEGWLDGSHYDFAEEWAYSGAERLLLVEEFIGSGDPPPDFKVLVFDGVPRLVQVHTSRFGEHASRQYTPDWVSVPGHAGRPAGPDAAPPQRLAEMLAAASQMAAGFDMLRVDFYDVDGDLWFGELTPYPGAGLVALGPELDALMGSWWTLPTRAAVRS